MKQSNLWIINYLDRAGRSGVHIDLETLKNFNVNASALITAKTKYDASSLPVLEPISMAHITKQWSVFKQQKPGPQIIKMGLIHHQALYEQIENFLSKYSGKLILDPLFLSHTDALPELVDSQNLANFIKLFPYTDILICNLLEVEKILNITLNTFQDIKEAASRLLKLGAKNILIKGGQLKKELFCQDYWSNQKESFWLATLRLAGKSNDKKGIFSAAIAACLARNYSLKDAIVIARMYVHRGLRKAYTENQIIKFFHSGWPEEQIDLPYVSANPLLKLPQAFKTYHTGLYPIVDSSQWVKKLLAQDVKTIQLRIKNANPLLIAQEIQRSVLLAKKYQAKLFINDYWKLAIQWGADGVHLGQEDLATADIDEIYQSGLYLGVSTHCYYEVACAHTLNPSYIACGPIYFTQSKPMSFQAQGVQQLNYWRRMLDYSLVAIGGITLERLSDVLQTGVHGIAVISAITQANDPGVASRKFLMQIQQKNAE